VAGDLGRGRVVGVDQGADRQHDPDLEADLVGMLLAGDPLDQGVGHDLVLGAFVAVGFQLSHGFFQCGEAGDAVFDRQQPGQQAHGVRGGPQRDPPVLPGFAGAGDGCFLVGLAGQPVREPFGLPRTLPAQILVG
jgi:hypothetical protein